MRQADNHSNSLFRIKGYQSDHLLRELQFQIEKERCRGIIISSEPEIQILTLLFDRLRLQAATIFQTNIGMTPLVSRIVAAANGTEYFLASWIAVYTIERFGRRNLMIYSAFAMSASMAILTGTTSPAALKPDPVTNESTNKAPAYVATVFLFLFNTFFAIGWLGMTWLYPAEITPLSIRAAANGISTSANWLFNFMVRRGRRLPKASAVLS